MSFAVIGTRREAAAAIEIHIEAELADRRNEVRSEVAFVVLVDLTIIIGKRFLHLMIDGFQRLGGCVAEDIEHQGGEFRARKSTRRNSSHSCAPRLPSYA